jgi:hypothetical protein
MPQRATRGSDLPRVACSVDIDLVISPENMFMLTHQRPIVRTVIQEGIENLQAALLFTNAFPDVCVALTLIKDSLLNAADHYGHMPGAMDILKQLIHNKDYLLKITPLVRPLYPEMTALTTLPVVIYVCGKAWDIRQERVIWCKARLHPYIVGEATLCYRLRFRHAYIMYSTVRSA